MKYLLLALIVIFSCNFDLNAQNSFKQLAATRTNKTIKIDGNLGDEAWKETVPATDFVEWRPHFGVVEDHDTRTEIFLLYDNTAIYVAGYCHERTSDSVSKELVGRDVVGINDYVGIIFDTYLDKVNGFGFYVTPLGEQFDAKYSNTVGEDGSWSAVWDSEAKVVADGWTFEMRIPYSALRFVSKDNQTWGLNITRNRRKTGRQFMWNPVDPKVNGFLNQAGTWTGIEKIDAPLRLSLSPYFSAYLNHFKVEQSGAKDWTSSVNGGMDIKYGISDAFTLDMTLVPDFGQVRSDNQILNLSPFEVRFEENRSFFTEGTELFNKGNLFYSRRVGGTPLRYGDAFNNLGPNEYVYDNPTESKLLNATKISGRTKKVLGVGFFNALTKPMEATIEDSLTKTQRTVETGPLTNYNIIVIDQTLKNNSGISFINTNTMRSGSDYDANVSAALFDFNNKKNNYNWNGKLALSQIFEQGKGTTGYSHRFAFSKTGNWNFQVGQELADKNYDINDMGILFNNNYVDHFLWTAYRWMKPTIWYNRIQLNFNAYHSQLFESIPGKKINEKFQSFNTNINGNIQLKNLWTVGGFVGYVTKGNDFYEPRTEGYSFRTPSRLQLNPWVQTNNTKKYFIALNYFYGHRSLFNSPNHEIDFEHRYRFNDKFSIGQEISFAQTVDDAGFYKNYYENNVLEDILFSRRNRKTMENEFWTKYSFNNKMGITFRARHYWSKVEIKQLYDLQESGDLVPTTHNGVPIEHQNFNIFNIDAVYTWQFAPGSFVNIVWKDESQVFNRDTEMRYFKNFERTLARPQNNNLSIKIIYYLDYLDLKKMKRKKG